MHCIFIYWLLCKKIWRKTFFSLDILACKIYHLLMGLLESLYTLAPKNSKAKPWFFKQTTKKTFFLWSLFHPLHKQHRRSGQGYLSWTESVDVAAEIFRVHKVLRAYKWYFYIPYIPWSPIGLQYIQHYVPQLSLLHK